ncbi:type II toxin-antitoxin system VapC family toxin [Synechococcus sp. PCC 6312]|uniref:type II toxin-antitoxin system VapC family toxin n=1 Tax=Synechococcus sp. (strain ATCC 27167 / PCC 6312) TaxID=195253 RepID=UPI00029ED49B|nr:type II toxin-antitoxin system VapC family toxin [Synechococcus sp. PCC 6312]AFY62733.1 putative nucleic-acid-binding protein, contains PIN domain [Synechococcus sp. PCC 6312]
MNAVDTNILVRLLTKDDELQFQQSLRLFQEQVIFIPDTVLLETEWVLRFAYQFKPADIGQAFRTLLGLPNVELTNGHLLLQALQWHENGLDFADALHLAQSQACSGLYTFDTKFIKKAQGLTACDVQQP